MTTLETYQIHEIITQNLYEFDEWYAYLSDQLNCTGDELITQLKYIEDASYLRNLYYDFFESSYNSFADDSD
jgi:hypothetical protein